VDKGKKSGRAFLCSWARKGTSMIREFIFYPISNNKPSNNTPVIAFMEETISKKFALRGGYFENGIFWDSNKDNASSLEESTKIEDMLVENWKIIEWCYSKL
jgi:hypothetical protein